MGVVQSGPYKKIDQKYSYMEAGIVINRTSSDFGFPQDTVRHMNRRYPDTDWGCFRSIDRSDERLVSEVTKRPRIFKGLMDIIDHHRIHIPHCVIVMS